MADWEVATKVALAALVLGLAYGFTAQRTGYCLRAGLEEALVRRREGMPRLRAFATALGVAMIGTAGLVSSGLVDLSATRFMAAGVPFVVIALGGLLFGLGMALAGGCISRLTVLSATGNLRSVTVLVIAGIAAYATMRGLFAWPRLWLTDATTVNMASAVPPFAMPLALGLGAALIAWAALGRVALSHYVGGAVIGLLVIAGWLVTAVLGADDFDPTPVESLSFVQPVADTVQYVMIATGASLKFGITLFVGVLIGSFLSAAAFKQVRLVGFESPRQMLRYFSGALLMGIGGVMALGCTVGQGLTGVATLSYASIVALAGIITGGVIGLRLLGYGAPRPAADQDAAEEAGSADPVAAGR